MVISCTFTTEQQTHENLSLVLAENVSCEEYLSININYHSNKGKCGCYCHFCSDNEELARQKQMEFSNGSAMHYALA